MDSGKDKFRYIYPFLLLLILAYPLRHVCLGVDLLDATYNYGNFRYNSLEYMDSMWYFATWLATACGSVLEHLPWGDTMLGMNVYTSLVIGLLGAGAFAFCVKRLRMPVGIAFAGELLALSLCWAPSAVLYNYLTYGLLLAGTMYLYQGLVTERQGYLLLAGAVLGLNVGVRFSNLVHAGLILAVWYYAFIEKKKLSKVLRETGICILGYLGSYGLFLLLMAVRYGLPDYVEGVLRLFAMTEQATDYSAGAMISGMFRVYFDDTGTYMLKRIALVFACGVACCAILPGKWIRVKQALVGLITLVLMVWLVQKGYLSRDYTTYNAIYYPCAISFLCAAGLSVMQIADRKAGSNQRLLALMVLLTIYLSSLGSNNAMYSSINNQFFVLPCFLWMAYRFWRDRKHMLYFPFKMLLTASILLLMVQGLRFGVDFVYEEATGARDTSAEIAGIPTLRGMHTSVQKVEGLTALYGYLRENGLEGRECILYGDIPGLAYCMELTPAFNIWSGLRSYGSQVMGEDIGEVEEEIAEGGERPVVILEECCRQYLERGSLENLPEDPVFLEKLQYLLEYMERQGYLLGYSDGEYAVYH